MLTFQQVMKEINKKWVGIFLLTLILGLFVYFYPLRLKKRKQEDQKHVKHRLGSYFFPFDICGFTSWQLPLLLVNLEDETIPLMIDLGNTGQMTLSSKRLQQIKEKKELQPIRHFGVRGKAYLEKEYEVPLIRIGNISFYNVPISEQSEEFAKDSSLHLDPESPDDSPDGSIGWHVFGNTNLLLDIKNKKIAFCDGLETLQKQGYFLRDFAKTKLFSNNKYLEVVADTSEGLLRCMLDTGATVSLLNAKGSKKPPADDEPLWDGSDPIAIPSFKIGGKEFGAGALFPVVLEDPFKADAVLGMDFFQEHVVFLDFLENCAYIAKAKDCSVNDDPS